ncbi:MAG: hypothetical protein NTV70_00640 [Acidobacteria bacterium]|nr:hypothetical protein [Acidobacteriota bacterium]
MHDLLDLPRAFGLSHPPVTCSFALAIAGCVFSSRRLTKAQAQMRAKLPPEPDHILNYVANGYFGRKRVRSRYRAVFGPDGLFREATRAEWVLAVSGLVLFVTTGVGLFVFGQPYQR